MLARVGVGTDSASALLVAAGESADRIGDALGGELPRATVGTYARGVTTTTERRRDARAKTDRALACVRADHGASPVLVAVVSEFAMKAEKAAHADDGRAAVIELEQAGDSA
jgi:hypothetical protein